MNAIVIMLSLRKGFCYLKLSTRPIWKKTCNTEVVEREVSVSANQNKNTKGKKKNSPLHENVLDPFLNSQD